MRVEKKKHLPIDSIGHSHNSELFCLIRPNARSKWCLTAKLSETEGVSGTISS